MCSSDLALLLRAADTLGNNLEFKIDDSRPSGRDTLGTLPQDRKSVVQGKSVDLGGRRITKKKTEKASPCRRRRSQRTPMPITT